MIPTANKFIAFRRPRVEPTAAQDAAPPVQPPVQPPVTPTPAPVPLALVGLGKRVRVQPEPSPAPQPPVAPMPAPAPVPLTLTGLGKRVRKQPEPPPAPASAVEPPAKRTRSDAAPPTPAPVAITGPPARRETSEPTLAVLEKQRQQPGASPVSEFLDDTGPERRYRASVPQSASVQNAVETAVAILGEQLARTARARGERTDSVQTIEGLTSMALVTGPSEDEEVLIEEGPRMSRVRAGVVVVAPPCCRGRAGCVSATHTWHGLPQGQMGPLLQAWLTPDESRQLEEGTLRDDGQFAGRMCLLCLWHLLLQIHVYTDVSNVLRAAPSAVVPRCPRVGTDGRSGVAEDTYAPDMLVVPPAGGSSPFAQPFPMLSMSLVRFYRDDRCGGKLRVSLESYRLAAPIPDFRTGAAANRT